MKSGRDKDGWRKKIERREEINNDLHCGSKTINIGVSVGWWVLEDFSYGWCFHPRGENTTRD
jgi:hypothetical protein